MNLVWHPMIVHFPLALIVTAAVCLGVAAVPPLAGRHASALALVGTWNLLLGAVALIAALASGLAAVLDLRADAAAHLAITAHVKSAILTAVLVLAAALWRSIGLVATSRPTVLFLLMLWLATGSLIVTGYRGGQNVYRHAIGVVDHERSALPPPPPHL